MDITNVIVGSGSTTKAACKVGGIPHSFLLGPDGNIVWQGHPAELTPSIIKSALKGAKKPAGGMFGVKTDLSVDARVAKAQKLAASGDLSAALRDLAAIDADAKSTDEQKNDAKAVQDAITRHVGHLNTTAEGLMKSREVGKALSVFEAISKELGANEFGVAAKKRVEAIRADTKLMAEFDAAKALDKMRDQVKSLSSEKTKGKYEEFAKKFAGTKAAERAKGLARGVKS